MRYDVIVIGGGAAGLMAASTAVSCGKSVLVLDKNEQLGRKLLITGKGRCNITNDCELDEFMRNIPTNGKFLYSAFSQFSSNDTKNFFKAHNVPIKTERGNRVFPQSDKAQDVCDALIASCQGATFKRECISSVDQKEQTFLVTCEGGATYLGDAVIIATGGKSYPQTGSTGDGYTFAKRFGHTITPPKPSLVPIVSKDEHCADMQGLSLKNVTLSLVDKEKIIYKELGEMLFTHYGVSGPLVLSASAHIRNFEPNRYTISLDLKPALSEQQLDLRILRDFEKFINKDFMNGLGDLLPRKMIPIIIMRSGIPPFTKINVITKEMRKNLVKLLKEFTISVDSFRPIAEAIITSGGVCINEINPKTMESKIANGLYFAGEVIDVDGYTGGFNLQIAFSSGYIAGANCCGDKT